MFYLVKTPWWLKKLYPKRVWDGAERGLGGVGGGSAARRGTELADGAEGGSARGAGLGLAGVAGGVETAGGSAGGAGAGSAVRAGGPAAVYLTFDDGPHPEATPFVLDELKKYNAKATFFCIGKNVQAYPEIYKRILMEGHAVGNHTQRHVNGWKVDDQVYVDDVAEARKYIDSPFFRPPYGRLGGLQSQVLRDKPFNFQIIMWDVLSGDFDRGIDAARCARNVVRNVRPGSIVVFHDSEKAMDRLRGALPVVMEFLAKKKWLAQRLT